MFNKIVFIVIVIVIVMGGYYLFMKYDVFRQNADFHFLRDIYVYITVQHRSHRQYREYELSSK